MRGVWTLAFLVNFFLLGSVFDIHFKSPIVHVASHHRAAAPPHSQLSPTFSPRLLFFVADGLRADTFFNNPHLRPYLTTVMKRRDGVAVGISDTRVPTESRPGHIALFAGFYEDPSAVFTGWKNNLVQFDSVFNQSKGSVALGSPDVVDMFAQGEAKSKIYSESYSPDLQDFLEANSSVLDTWVFDKFQNLVLQKRLPRHDNLIIFLHLLGIDNTGHATKPHSKEYAAGLTIVDDIVSKVEKMMAEYYKDENTLFVFTSDHGMTDWGSHGSGSVEETETPILVWGPGIKKTENLRLNQADIASLVAGSLGASFPSNSVGKFPSRIWEDKSFAYANLRANFLQVMELTRTKKDRVLAERNFPLVEFPGEGELSQVLVLTDKLAKSGELVDAIARLDSAFLEALRANVYYERFNQTLMICFSVAIFFLLMILVASSILSLEFSDRDLSRLSFVFDLKLLLWGIGISTAITKGIIGWSMWKMGYSFVPVYLGLLLTYKFSQKIVVRQKAKLVWSLGLSIFGVQLLVLSFWERSVLSVALFLNLIWVLWSHSQKNRLLKGWDLILHLVAVGVLALFPIVPIIGRDRSPFFTTMGPLVSCGMVGLGLAFVGRSSAAVTNPGDQLVLGTQLFLQAIVALLSHFPTFVGTRLLAWTSLILSIFCPTMTTSNRVVLRLLSIFLALGTPFSILGVSYETLFFPSLFLVLLLFLKLEIDEQSGEESGRTWSEFFSVSRQEPVMGLKSKQEAVNIQRAFRRAWLHLFFVFLSFFGTGNIGSVSSFDPSSTRCFVSVFNPWVMMVLMLTKILAPFLLVSSFWRALLPSERDVERNFGILLLLCQGMSLTMFFRVRNTGSWLDIGMSISHFVIVQTTTMFLLVFHFIANWLVTHELMTPSSLPIAKKANSRGSKRL